MGILTKAVKKAAKASEKATKKAAKKAAKKKAPEKKGKKVELEGARANADTRGSYRAAREVEAGRAGEVTKGKEVGFLQAQRTPSSRAAAKVKAELSKKKREGTATKAELDELAAIRKKDRMDKLRADIKASQTAKSPAARKAREAKARTDYVDPESGEIVGNPTKAQLEAAMRNARARNMTSREREYRAFLEKEYGADFNKGGVVKAAKGSHDYRMNKGGLLLSSVDNRKKK